MSQTYEIVDKSINKYGRFNLIIDGRGLKFTDEAYMLWKQKIDDEQQFKEKMNYMIFALDYSSKSRAAKKRRESEIIRFFYDFDEGSNWLLRKVSIGKNA